MRLRIVGNKTHGIFKMWNGLFEILVLVLQDTEMQMSRHVVRPDAKRFSVFFFRVLQCDGWRGGSLRLRGADFAADAAFACSETWRTMSVPISSRRSTRPGSRSSPLRICLIAPAVSPE